jgi:hypothetical protein
LAEKSTVLQLPFRNTEDPLKMMMMAQHKDGKALCQGERGAQNAKAFFLEMFCFFLLKWISVLLLKAKFRLFEA